MYVNIFKEHQKTTVLGVRNWIWVAAATVVVAGCGGGDGVTTTGGDIGGGGGGGGISRSRATITLGSNAVLQTMFISGSARRAVGSQVATIDRVRYTNAVTDFVPGADQITQDIVNVMLDGYTLNTYSFGIPMPGLVGRSFTQYPMEIAKLSEVAADGSLTQLSPVGQVAYRPAVPFDVSMRILPGRITTMSVRLDDSMMSFSNIDNAVVFNQDAFVSGNYVPTFAAIPSYLSDYIAFDLSSMADGKRPEMVGIGSPAEQVYYSGDGISMSIGMGNGSTFQLLDPILVQAGRVNTGPLIGPAGSQVRGSNTYALEDEDPANTKLTSLIGTWKPFKDVISSTEGVVAVSFPSSRETASLLDTEEQQFVLVMKNGAGTITDMWQGQVFFNTAGDQTQGTFRLFPVATITDAVPTGQVTGTVSNLTISGGVVKGGDWDVTSVKPVSWTFPDGGGFAVFRK